MEDGEVEDGEQEVDDLLMCKIALLTSERVTCQVSKAHE